MEWIFIVVPIVSTVGIIVSLFVDHREGTYEVLSGSWYSRMELNRITASVLRKDRRRPRYGTNA